MKTSKNSGYEQVKFYAEVARKGSRKLTGTILVVAPWMVNGTCVAAIGRPADGAPALPVTTWVYPEYLANRAYEVTEAEAREIDPVTFRAVDGFQRAEEYRAGYAVEIKKPGKAGGLQPALERDYPDHVNRGGTVADQFYRIYGQ